MSHAYDYDYFVIGGGSGGVRSARIAASHGAKVGIAEELYWGGTCVNVGCVPKKLLSYASHFSYDFEDARGFGWDVPKTISFNWDRLIKNKDKEIERLNNVYRSILNRHQVNCYEGRAHFLDAHTIEINHVKVTADKFLIATGGWPYIPHHKGAREHAINSNDIFFLNKLPEKILIVGGGYIAVEFASILNGLGSQVTLAYRGDMILRGFDDNLRQHLFECLKSNKIDILLHTDIQEITEKDGQKHVTFSNNKEDSYSHVFYATGRKPKTEGLGLDLAGVMMDENGAVIVNEKFQTNQSHIYAVGDVINRVSLTPVAIQEGHILADHLFQQRPLDMNYEIIASAVFTTPPIGTVGLTEVQARQSVKKIDIYESQFRPMKYTISGRAEKTYMKLIVDHQSQKVLGCHMIGPDAPEIIQMAGIALQMSAKKKDFDATMAVHPTASEEFVTMREISRH